MPGLGPAGGATHHPATSPYLAHPPLPVHSHAVTSFSWWLPFQNQDWLQAEYDAVHDPTSPRYLDFQPSEAIAAKVAPSQSETVAPVLAFLTGGNIPSQNISQVHGQLRVNAQVHVLEALFGVTFQLYRLSGLSNMDGLLRTNQSITIPAEVAPHLALLTGLNELPARLIRDQPRRARRPSPSTLQSPPPLSSSAVNSSSSHSFTPMSTSTPLLCAASLIDFAPSQFIAQQCGYYPATATAPANPVKLAIIGGFQDMDNDKGQTLYEFYSPQDLVTYASELSYSITAPSINPLFGSQDADGYATADGGVASFEVSLDIDMAFSFCPQCSIGLIPVPQADANNFFLAVADVYNAIAAMDSASQPHIVSLSFGYAEIYLNLAYTEYIEGILQQLTTAGVTLVVASGDNGANTDLITVCSADTLAVPYPATSAYVTSVGSTEYYNGVTAANHDSLFNSADSTNQFCAPCPPGGVGVGLPNNCQVRTAGPQRAVKAFKTGSDLDVTGFESGGGFSMNLAQPTAQAAAVAAYLNVFCTPANGCTLPPTGDFNPNNRAVPDVSFYGSRSPVGVDNYLYFFTGTSVSAPAFAGLLANLVQYYQTAKGTTMGLGDVKGLLYGAQAATAAGPGPLQAFNDVQIGDNTCPSPNSDMTACSQTGCLGYGTAPGWVSPSSTPSQQQRLQ